MSAPNFARAQFRRMLVTTTITAVITFLSGVADTVFAGHLFGSDALAGLNLLAPVNSLILFLCTSVASGAAICRSIATGRCDRREMDSCCSTGLWATAAVSVGLGLMFLGREAYFSVMGVKGAARSMASAYCGGFWAVAALTPWFYLLTGLIGNDGGHRHCRLALGANLAVKFALSVPFGRLFGVAGLAWASVAALVAALAVAVSYLPTKACTLRFRGGFSPRVFASGLRFSCLDQLFMLGEMVKMAVINLFVVSRFGEGFLPVVAAFSAVSMLTCVQSATATAAQPVMGVYFGEGNYPRVRDVARHGLAVTAAIGLAASLALVLFPQAVTRFIGLADPTLLPHAHLAVRIAAVFLVFVLLCGFADSYYLYTEHFALSLAMVVLDSCLAPLAFGLGFGIAFAETGFWFGLAVAPLAVLALVLGVLCLRFGAPGLLPTGRDAGLRTYDLALTTEAIVAVSEKVMGELVAHGLYAGAAARAPLIVEEALMIVYERNRGRQVLAEVTLDLNDGVGLTIRDDGAIFDITDADASVSSLRAYLVANVMVKQRTKVNLVTTGTNRSCFRF